MNEYTNLIITQSDEIQWITINRPNQLNALNKLTIDELHHAILTASSNDDVRVIVLTGSGEKAFVAGADIKEFADFTTEQGKNLAKEGQDKLFNVIENCTKPVIAAVNGFALGGGLELAMASHIRIASSNARLGLPEVSLGVIPGYGGTQRLAQLVGKGKANEMIFTAGMISAAEALQWGLVNDVCEPTELLEKVTKIADKIKQNSPNAISQAIRAVNASVDNELNGFEVEIEAFGACFGTPDFYEGTSAFIEKRKPNFKNR
jgi:enoyl-CoA hydratase